ncbi:hypothetical protein PHLGIDRAFT_10156 [Phlebiopsis gigantea 11061_1 CR5-6]|uniref:Uncharacterized protein n=1 Tax=Phlebiopsis gigantea (strain 11061_1 CR5-6) TaxID=745531 RepID=A0A0C3SE33_PHLG1|nr:hypothetical protein PHLGIDRAFT_10156 [Phlebiopsis gigantea 11061_1 CR5-6]
MACCRDDDELRSIVFKPDEAGPPQQRRRYIYEDELSDFASSGGSDVEVMGDGPENGVDANEGPVGLRMIYWRERKVKAGLLEAMKLKIKDKLYWWDETRTEWIKAKTDEAMGRSDCKLLLVRKSLGFRCDNWHYWVEKAEKKHGGGA